MTPRQHDFGALRWRFLKIADDAVDYRGQTFPRHFRSVLTHPEWPADAEVTVYVDVDRGPVLTGLVSVMAESYEPVPYRRLQEIITATIDERHLLRELTADAVGAKVQEHMLAQELTPEQWAARGESREHAEHKASRYREAVRSKAYAVTEPRRRRLLTREYLDRVATVYREALTEGRPPTVAVQETFGVSHSNASKYVRKARDVGALGPADSTRAGEAKES